MGNGRLYLQFPTILAGELTGLVGANPHTLRAFGRIKGTKQTITDEFRRHTAARICYVDRYSALAFNDGDIDSPTGRRCILGIPNQMRQSLLRL